MNIAFVNSTRRWGGVKTWCLNIGKALEERGHGVYVYGRPGPFPKKAQELGLNAQEVRFGVDGNPLTIWFFLQEFRKYNIDVCICNVSKDLRTAGIAAKFLGIPIIHRLGDPGDLKNRFKTWATQYFLKPRLLACSEFCKAGLIRSVPMLGKYDFQAIHPGVFPAPTPPSTIHKPRVVITSCQLDRDKGHKDMFYALKKVREQGIFVVSLWGLVLMNSLLKSSVRQWGLMISQLSQDMFRMFRNNWEREIFMCSRVTVRRSGLPWKKLWLKV